MILYRRLILCAAVGVLAIGIAVALLSRSTPWQTVGPLRSADVRDIQRTVLRERWNRVIRGVWALEFKLASLHLQEMIVGRTRIVTSDGADEARVEFREASETGRRWSYQLEHATNGWKVIGVGYRSALITRPPKQPDTASQGQPVGPETNSAPELGRSAFSHPVNQSR